MFREQSVCDDLCHDVYDPYYDGEIESEYPWARPIPKIPTPEVSQHPNVRCPCCGGDTIRKEFFEGIYTVTCGGCGCGGFMASGNTLQAALNRWNEHAKKYSWMLHL